MREHFVNSLDNFICGWYPEDTTICDKVLEFYNSAENKNPGKVGKGIDLLVKRSTDVSLVGPLYSEYDAFLGNIVKLYVDKYPMVNYYSPWKILEDINVQGYKPSEAFYSWHCERPRVHSPSVMRHMVFMTYLNDVTDGGETEFLHQNIKIKPEKGLTLFWPVDWTFTHRGVPSMTQEKYIVTGWFNYYA
jgi:hypothetical protein